MIVIYSFVLVLLGGLRFVVQRRAATLGRRYSALARSVQELLQSSALKYGNTNRVDPCQWARQQYELGQLVKRRDQIEARHFAWQTWSERLGRGVERLRSWKGQKLPYTLGVVDVWLLLALVDHLGVGELVSARRIVQMVTGLLTSD